MNQVVALAVLVRRAQWLLDDFAYALTARGCTTDEYYSLALTLEELGRVLRATSLGAEPGCAPETDDRSARS